MRNMKFLKASASSICIAALVACGGGGGEESVNNNTGTITDPNAALAPRINEVPQITNSPSPYISGSIEDRVFNHANRVKSECGFGMFSNDQNLSAAATNHAKYMTWQSGTTGKITTHEEINKQNPWFTGSWPTDRATHTRYNSFAVSEGLVALGSLNPNFDPTSINMSLLNAPYHALDFLAPRMHLAVGAEWASKMGLTNLLPHEAASIGMEWGAVVNNYGSPVNSAGTITVQALPANDVLTWPCSATSEPVTGWFWGETPDPLPHINLAERQVGSPFYFVARLGSNLKITSAKLTNVSTNTDVPLMPTRHMKNEALPVASEMMESAFVFPDVKLPPNSTFRMDFSAEINGKPIQKSVTYRTKIG